MKSLILVLAMVSGLDGKKDVFSKPAELNSNKRTIEALLDSLFKIELLKPKTKTKYIYPLYFNPPIDKYKHTV